MTSGGKRIVFTGGSGKAGRHVIPELIKRGHKVDLEMPSIICGHH
jgi:nucleoside-diphosphate-sugar epimerase